MQASESLNAIVEGGIPSEIRVGRGMSMFLEGSCSHPDRRVRALRLLVDGEPHPTLAHSMPGPGSRRSGDWWWGIVDFGRVVQPRTVTVGLEARVGPRRWVRADLGRTRLEPGRRRASIDFGAAADRGDGAITGALSLEPTVAICVSGAAHLADADSATRRLGAIAEQTYGSWVCVIDHDPQSGDREVIEQAIAGEQRFMVHDGGNPSRSVRESVERALTLAPIDAPYLVLIDDWELLRPETIERMLDALEPEMGMLRAPGLAASDRAGSFAPLGRRGGSADLESLALGGRATDGCLLFRRELLDSALPIPSGLGGLDPAGWLTLIAESAGEVGALEMSGAGPAMAAGPSRAQVPPTGGSGAGPARDAAQLDPAVGRNWRAHYFDRFVGALLAARVIEARCGAFVSRGQRRELSRLSGQERSPLAALRAIARAAFRRLSPRGVRSFEPALVRALAWRHLVAIRARLISLTGRD